MLLLAHTLTGAVIGAKIANPWTVAVLGTLSHFVLDFLPHWNFDRPRKIRFKDFFRIWPDIAASIAIYVTFIFLFPELFWQITIGAFFAIVPDVLSLLENTKPAKTIFKWYFVLHEKIQHEIHFVPGILVQVIFIGLMLLILQF